MGGRTSAGRTLRHSPPLKVCQSAYHRPKTTPRTPSPRTTDPRPANPSPRSSCRCPPVCGESPPRRCSVVGRATTHFAGCAGGKRHTRPSDVWRVGGRPQWSPGEFAWATTFVGKPVFVKSRNAMQALGISTRTADVIIAETGADMTRFPTAGQLRRPIGVERSPALSTECWPSGFSWPFGQVAMDGPLTIQSRRR